MCKYAPSLLIATIFQEHITLDQVSGKHRSEIPSKAESDSIVLWQWCRHEVSLAGPLINLWTKTWQQIGLCNKLSVLTWISIQPLLLCANAHSTTSAEQHSLFHRDGQEQQYNTVSRGDTSMSQLRCWNLNTRRSSRHRPGITYFWNSHVTARSTVFQNCESFTLDGEKKHSSACSNHKKMHWATGQKWMHLMVFQRKYSMS